MLYVKDNKLIRKYNGELMQIEAYSKNSFRVRVTQLNEFPSEDWALSTE